jgi:hypothetical protein
MPRRIRAREVELLESLLTGPRSLDQGPVGACLRKGWIADVANQAQPARLEAMAKPLFALTDAGRAALNDAAHAGAVAAAPQAVAGHGPARSKTVQREPVTGARHVET